MLILAAVLLLQSAIALFCIARFPQSSAAILRAAAVLIDAAAASARGTAPATRHYHRVKIRTGRNPKLSASKESARQLEAPSEKLEYDLIRCLVRYGSSESAARLHVLNLRERGLIT